jgi:hypothetical protein
MIVLSDLAFHLSWADNDRVMQAANAAAALAAKK